MLQGIQNYLTELDDLRTQGKELLQGLPQETLNWCPIGGEGELAVEREK